MKRLRNDPVMNSKENFIIDKPYSLQPEDEQAISNVQNKGLTVHSWSDKELDSLKENMRNYLRKKQNGLCAFCRMKSLKDMTVTDYPTDGEEFLFVNPYFDRYSEHIEIKNDILYMGITDKGKYTVKECKLNRWKRTFARAENVIQNNANGFISIFLLINNPAYTNVVEDKDKIINRLHLKERMQQYKAKHRNEK